MGTTTWQRVRAVARTRCHTARFRKIELLPPLLTGRHIGYIYLRSRCIAPNSTCRLEPDIAGLLRAKGNGFERPVGRPGGARDLCKSRPIAVAAARIQTDYSLTGSIHLSGGAICSSTDR